MLSGYPDRVPTFDAAAVDCQVSVFREGLLTSFGHDVTLQVTNLFLDVGEDDGITADFDPGSLRVTTDISASDRQDIEKMPRRYSSRGVSEDPVSFSVGGVATAPGRASRETSHCTA